MAVDPILVVDDDDALRATLVEAMEPLPVEITAATTGLEAQERLQKRRFAVVVTDLVMKDVDGFAVLKTALERHPYCRVVMLTGHGSREVAVEAMQKGATYYIEKPVDLAELRTKVQKFLDEHQKDMAFEDLRSQVSRDSGLEGIIGHDPKLERVLAVVRQIAPTGASVLILGAAARARSWWPGRSTTTPPDGTSPSCPSTAAESLRGPSRASCSVT